MVEGAVGEGEIGCHAGEGGSNGNGVRMEKLDNEAVGQQGRKQDANLQDLWQSSRAMMLRERNKGVSGIYLQEDKESCERRRSSNAIVSPNLTFETRVAEFFNEQCRCSFVVNMLVNLHKCVRSTSHSGNSCSQLPIFIAARDSSSTAHSETASIIAKQQWDIFSRHHWQSQLNT